ncbi:MAG: regulatory iron-sulfur-containing complex subunit RicT [Candidatus Moranbacteria bacterium]|nr:regulatory iron-sulfur-containing complex subunit RicT [Candidatus Moranbacteria bacterium]
MSLIFLKIRPWESRCFAKTSHSLEKGDLVIVESEEGTNSAIVEKVITEEKKPGNCAEVKLVRKANLRDVNLVKSNREKEAEAVKICRDEVRKSDLPMKIVGASYSFDGGMVSFAFIADGRIDFRELVKTLSKKFQRSIRLHQVGARDEARSSGGYGICGRELCCIRFSDDLPSITSDMAKSQQIVHRGSERISGLCGRLMCCLAYEAGQYQKMLEKMPEIRQEIKTKEGKGIVKKMNALTETVFVELENGNRIEVKIKDV